MRFSHNYPFDPGYGYSLDELLAAPAPEAPEDFQRYWRQRYLAATSAATPRYTLSACGGYAGFSVHDISYSSTAGFTINGWLLVPEHQEVRQAIVVGHGYGGREQPDYHLAIPYTAFLFPCFRGLARSRCSSVSEQPQFHVLHNIHSRDDYILGGCVEDIWLAVTVLQLLYPQIGNAIGYMGISFGGGIGALALPWDTRIKRAHLNVPTFGNQPLRMTLQSVGSAAVVRDYLVHHGNIAATLAYYDAAIAAKYAVQSAHFALALFDPVVAPPGQFAVYNAWAGEKRLFVLEAGHFDYPNQAYQNILLLEEIKSFFGDMQS
ncbi:MAG: acetylxylan esterase [Methylomonas sp.]